MTRSRIYLDYNATAPLVEPARAAMLSAMDLVGNPSSVHGEGRAARAIVEDAREAVAALVGAKPAQVVFTSGATEANAWVLSGNWSTILMCGMEHDSVRAAARASGAEIRDIAARRDGVIEPGTIATHVLKGPSLGRALLTLQWANNETGAVQPVADVAAFARAHGLYVHSDAVQACGRCPVDMPEAGIDALSLSAHKIGGPKGIGALVIGDALTLPPLVPGGQERRRRGGTENVIGIAGFGAAAAAARDQIAGWRDVAALRDRLERDVVAAVPETVVVAAEAPRLPNTSLLALPGRRAETLVIRLDLMGLSVSAGAACSSGKVGASHVLAAMGLPADVARAAIRVSLGPATTQSDIAAFVAAWREIASGAAQREQSAAG